VGNRVIWMMAAKAGPRLHSIELGLMGQAPDGMKGWSWVGEQAFLAPKKEMYRYMPPESLQGYAMQQFIATEDNLVLFLVRTFYHRFLSRC
jgi:hypothetical protein